jgi:hypothetical protein
MLGELERARAGGDTTRSAEILKSIEATGIGAAREQATQEADAKANDPSYRALMDIKGLLGKPLAVVVNNMPKEGLGPEEEK